VSAVAKDRERVDAHAHKGASRRAGRADEIIGARIRSVRNDAGMTLESLADRVGISCQQLYKYESGANRITVSRLIDVADALQVDLEVLLEFNRTVATPETATPRASDVLKLVTSFCAIKNPASRDKILELAEFLAGFETSDSAGSEG